MSLTRAGNQVQGKSNLQKKSKDTEKIWTKHIKEFKNSRKLGTKIGTYREKLSNKQQNSSKTGRNDKDKSKKKRRKDLINFWIN